MFRIHDYELTETELSLLETSAHVAADGFISFAGQSRATERRTYNLCELLLQWATAEEYGVQRIRFGAGESMTKRRWISWRKNRKAFSLAVAARGRALRAFFPAEDVRLKVLGWRLLNVDYLSPKNMVKIAEAHEAKTTRMLVQCSDKSTSRTGAKPQ